MNSKLLKIKEWAELVRDIGLIISVPTIIIIGMGLYERQIDAVKAEIEVYKAAHETSKKIQYDRAWKLIDGQKKAFEFEREQFTKIIKDLEIKGKTSAAHLRFLKTKLRNIEDTLAKDDNFAIYHDDNVTFILGMKNPPK